MSTRDDDEIITWWGLVMEGYHVTHNEAMREIRERFGLPADSFDVLVRLVRSPGHRMPMTRLAQETSFSSGGFTKVADRLAAAGLISRVRCDADRRVSYATLTEHGLAVATEARRACAEILRRRVLAPLGTEAAERLACSMRALREANGTCPR